MAPEDKPAKNALAKVIKNNTEEKYGNLALTTRELLLVVLGACMAIDFPDDLLEAMIEQHGLENLIEKLEVYANDCL